MSFQLSLPMVMDTTNRTILNELFGARWDPQTKRQQAHFEGINFAREVYQEKKKWLAQAIKEKKSLKKALKIEFPNGASPIGNPELPWKSTFWYACHVRYVACAALSYKIIYHELPSGFELDSPDLDGWRPQ